MAEAGLQAVLAGAARLAARRANDYSPLHFPSQKIPVEPLPKGKSRRRSRSVADVTEPPAPSPLPSRACGPKRPTVRRPGGRGRRVG